MGALLGARTELAPGPGARAFPGRRWRVNTCARAGPGRVRGRADRVCPTSPRLSKPGHLLGTALQLRLAWAGLPEDTLHARSPAPPPQPYTHTPAAYTRRQESGVGSWLGLGQGGGGDTEPATLSRHSGGHGAWLGLAGRDRQVSVGLGALVAVKSSAGVRGQCRRECKVQVFSLGPSTLLQPKGTRTAATPRNLSYSQESPKPGPLSKQPGMSSSVLGQKEP